MALIKLRETSTEMDIKLNNGDFIALQKVQDKWKFKDKESALRFALAILAKVTESEKNNLFLDTDGLLAKIEPNNSLLQTPDIKHPVEEEKE